MNPTISYFIRNAPFVHKFGETEKLFNDAVLHPNRLGSTPSYQ